MSEVIQFVYLVAAVLLIIGMRNLASPKTAPRGNLIAAVGMGVAIVATLLIRDVVGYVTILAGVLVGSAIGALVATRIQMTAMPQMVALLNGFGGGASALVGSAELLSYARVGEEPTGIVPSKWFAEATRSGSPSGPFRFSIIRSAPWPARSS